MGWLSPDYTLRPYNPTPHRGMFVRKVCQILLDA